MKNLPKLLFGETSAYKTTDLNAFADSYLSHISIDFSSLQSSNQFLAKSTLEWLHYLVQGLVKIIRVMRGVKWHKESMIRS